MAVTRRAKIVCTMGPATATAQEFRFGVQRYAEWLARDASIATQLREKRSRRARDEEAKPLAAYREEELARSYECFFGPDRSYHEARRRFVYKPGPA